MIGYPARPPRHYRLGQRENGRRALIWLRTRLVAEVAASEANIQPVPQRSVFIVDGGFRLRIAVVTCRLANGRLSWYAKARTPTPYDIFLAARLDVADTISDYFFLPNLGAESIYLNLAAPYCAAFRSISLRPLHELCARQRRGSKLPRTAEEFKTFMLGILQEETAEQPTD